MLSAEVSSLSAVRPLTVSIKSAAAAIGVGRTRMYELLANGSISAVKCGRRVLIPISQLEGFVAALPPASFRPAEVASKQTRTPARTDHVSSDRGTQAGPETRKPKGSRPAKAD